MGSSMRLRHIEVFNAVMLTGSVSGAARLINVTQPAVSRILQHAELQLGFALFQRNKGRLTATAEALKLYPLIERLFEQGEKALIGLDFLRPSHPKRLLPRLRRLFARARLEKEEVNILRGILARIEERVQDGWKK